MAEVSKAKKQELEQKHIGGRPSAGNAPTLYAMVGIPASGKTTFLAQQKKKNALPPDHYYHNPDVIMTDIPDYQSDAVRKGLDQARRIWEMPSRHFSDQELFPLARQKRLNIVMDMGMGREEILHMVQSCKAEGYFVELHIIYCPVHEALKRREQREHHVPENVIRERSRFIADNIERILELSDDIHAYNNEALGRPFQPLSLEKLRAYLQRGG